MNYDQSEVIFFSVLSFVSVLLGIASICLAMIGLYIASSGGSSLTYINGVKAGIGLLSLLLLGIFFAFYPLYRYVKRLYELAGN